MKWGMGALVLFNAFMSISYAGPQLELDSASADFGTFPANQQQSTEFILTNIGDEPLDIKSIRSTCGCAVGKLEQTELQPGDSAKLAASIVPESIAGPFAKALFIQSNDPAGPKTITLRGNSIPLITVKPQPMIYAGTLTAGHGWRQEFLLETSQPVKFGDVSIEGLPGAEVTICLQKTHGEAEENSSVAPLQNSYLVTVSFTPGDGLEQFRGSIQLPVMEPAGWKPAELFIYGQIAEDN
ncbi:DUF1573 domain-containing protein [Victivallis sp. Marseille-Q1083]|uniref:DUF1573 domain-containing protein n=1 Tax=Victivallis sp. Marseille-Q1083 TaxID=2717288 RepID=UPI00158EF052|nr:DUF1573 domain-containing protein [Victivallis sp. Marseille-Q1083]